MNAGATIFASPMSRSSFLEIPPRTAGPTGAAVRISSWRSSARAILPGSNSLLRRDRHSRGPDHRSRPLDHETIPPRSIGIALRRPVHAGRSPSARLGHACARFSASTWIGTPCSPDPRARGRSPLDSLNRDENPMIQTGIKGHFPRIPLNPARLNQFQQPGPQEYLSMTRDAFWPPKPKLFESATFSRISRAVFGT